MVSVVPSFGSKWLLHRLDRFRDEHPDIDVRIDATVRMVDLVGEGIDLAIRYGGGDYPGMRSERLLDDVILPVCSPDLLTGKHPLKRPEDLRHHLLLRSEWHSAYTTWPDWPMWLKAAGLEDLEVRYSPKFTGDVETMLIDAAIKGRGVALASAVLVDEDLRSGRLVSPFEVVFPQRFGYYLVTPESVPESPKVAAFREWTLREVNR